MYKYVVLASVLAAAQAGYLGAPAAVAYAPAPYASHAIGSQTQSVYRSPDGNHAVSTYTKAVDSAYSSVRKYDTRVSNDAIIAPAGVAYAAHAAPLAYAAPAVAKVAAPVAYAAPAYAASAYAAPAYAAPGYARVAAPVAHAGLLGVAYSAAPAVAHISYSNGYGIQYAY